MQLKRDPSNSALTADLGEEEHKEQLKSDQRKSIDLLAEEFESRVSRNVTENV